MMSMAVDGITESVVPMPSWWSAVVWVMCMAASFLLVVMCRAGALLERLQGTGIQEGMWENPIKDRYAHRGGSVDLAASFLFSHSLISPTCRPGWGFLYQAVVIDVWSRRGVGWAMGERMTADLMLAALEHGA
ncbi:hypothetical protein [Ottowia thiooxydans]|uniref:Transposase InsO family protein n=1 Tax=Ottowia thiooxydans TaxID=219182 RepID=A0ABV2QEL0_9BURK